MQLSTSTRHRYRPSPTIADLHEGTRIAAVGIPGSGRSRGTAAPRCRSVSWRRRRWLRYCAVWKALLVITTHPNRSVESPRLGVKPASEKTFSTPRRGATNY